MKCYDSEHKFDKFCFDVCLNRCVAERCDERYSKTHKAWSFFAVSKYLESFQVEIYLHDGSELKYTNLPVSDLRHDLVIRDPKNVFSFLCPECPYYFEHLVCGVELFNDQPTRDCKVKCLGVEYSVLYSSHNLCFVDSPCYLL